MPVSGSVFIINLAVGVFVMVQLVNVWEIVSSAKCVCTNYRLAELVVVHVVVAVVEDCV